MERALAVTLKVKEDRNAWHAEERAAELTELAISSGAEVISEVISELIVVRDRPTPGFFIGRGKAEEISRFVEKKNVDLVILVSKIVLQRNDPISSLIMLELPKQFSFHLRNQFQKQLLLIQIIVFI